MKSKYEKQAANSEERRRSTEAVIASVTPGGKRSRITDYLAGDAASARREAHQSLALMFEGCHIPEQIIDDPLFVNAIRDVVRAGKNYVPPGRKYIGGSGLQACRRGIESGLVGIKASWKKVGVIVASDMMTDRNGRPQANVFLVNDAGAVLHVCVDCNMEKKTGGYIAGLLKPVVEEIVPCATHFLDLLMEDVEKLGWAKGVVDRAGEMNWVGGDRKKAAEGFAAQVLDAAWWKTTEFFTKLMKLPFIAMRHTDGSAKGMMGRKYDIMLQLTEDVEALVDVDEEQLSRTDKQQIRRILQNRWDGSLACAMHVAGRILNPAN
ncbi:unnamed protein product [Closterium sp. NIES-54]